MTTPRPADRLAEVLLESFTPGDVALYAEASGDSNPIHVDPDAAAAAGLDGPIVHGMLVMSHMVRLAEAWRAGAVVAMARALFVAPVRVGEKLAVEGRVVARQGGGPATQWTLRLTARNAAGTIAAIVETRMIDAGQPSTGAQGI